MRAIFSLVTGNRGQLYELGTSSQADLRRVLVKSCTLYLSFKFGMVVHITKLNIFRYGGVAPVPPGGRWRHLHLGLTSNHIWPIKPEFRVAI